MKIRICFEVVEFLLSRGPGNIILYLIVICMEFQNNLLPTCVHCDTCCLGMPVTNIRGWFEQKPEGLHSGWYNDTFTLY